MTYRSLTLLLLCPITVACDRIDYHGVEPQVYNEVLYPKVNRVESATQYHSFFYKANSSQLGDVSANELDAFIGDIYPSSVEVMTLTFARPNAPRELQLTRYLRSKGFTKKDMRYTYDAGLQPDQVEINLTYSYVVTPDCPDWRKSSDLNYSNTNASFMKCATVSNLGHMVSRPRDLIRSNTNHISPDATLNSLAIVNYHSGEATNQPAEAAANSTGGAE